MKFTLQTILSLPVDGASAHLLTFNSDIKILLDCGISHNFNFSQYQKRAADLKKVALVLISHSSLQYSGAMCFLIQQLGLNPKIFYTTQPIMRYSPLNVHQQLLILRHSSYGKKIFNKIYKYYESIQLVKPHQKKYVDLSSLGQTNKKQVENKNEVEENQMTITQSEKVIYFTCYSAGGSLGSIAWRISYGLVNIVYLVQYNNYSLYHINGLDIDNILQPTDVLITDTYKDIGGDKLKKQDLYEKIKNIVNDFNSSISENQKGRNQSMLAQTEKKLLITCYPNEIMIEVMAILFSLLQENQQLSSRDKIKVIHLSSRYLQLIKSQIDYFSDNFKETLEKTDDFFIQTKGLGSRINIATIHSLNGILNQSVDKNVKIYHVGSEINPKSMKFVQSEGKVNVSKMKLMQVDEKIPSSAIIEESQEMANEDLKNSQKQVSQFPDETQGRDKDKSEYLEDDQFNNPEIIHGKYFSQICFPHFTSQYPDEEHDYDDYGIRHHYQRFDHKKTIEDYRKEEEMGLADINMQKKNSSIDIQIMNIEFKLQQAEEKPFDKFQINFTNKVIQRTNFNSSLQLIANLKPSNVIFINAHQKDPEMYRNQLKAIPEYRSINVFDMSKKIIHLPLHNELVSYKMNYIPIPTERKLQKVKGAISYRNGFLEIRLDCISEKQILEFRMDKFYKLVKISGEHECKFTGNGIIIDGVKLYRENNKVILEGSYSEEYFNVRKLLYDFLKLT